MVDLPSIYLAMETLEADMSDASSLNNAPRSPMDLEEDFGSSLALEINPLRGGSGRLGMSSRFMYSDGEGSLGDSEDESLLSPKTRRQAHPTQKIQFSGLVNLPVEVRNFSVLLLEVRLIKSSFSKRSHSILPTATCTASPWLLKYLVSSSCQRIPASGRLDFCPYMTSQASKALTISALDIS
jgi:hypothetical protein